MASGPNLLEWAFMVTQDLAIVQLRCTIGWERNLTDGGEICSSPIEAEECFDIL